MTPSPVRNHGRPPWLAVSLRIVLSILLLAFLIHSVDLSQAKSVVNRVDPGFAALAALVLAAVPAISIPRWRAILAALGYELPAKTLAYALYVGALLNQALPSSIGGDAWRVWFCVRAGIPLSPATSSVLIERLVGLAAVLLCFALTFPVLLERVADGPMRALLWLMLAACMAIVAGLAFVAAFASRLGSVSLLRPLAGLGHAIALVSRSVSRLALLLWTGILGQIAAIIAFFFANQSAHSGLSLLDCAVTLAPGLLVALVPLSLGGWGLREGAFVVLLSFYGISPETSLVASVLFGLALLVASLPGLLFWLHGPPVIAKGGETRNR